MSVRCLPRFGQPIERIVFVSLHERIRQALKADGLPGDVACVLRLINRRAVRVQLAVVVVDFPHARVGRPLDVAENVVGKARHPIPLKILFISQIIKKRKLLNR